MRTTYDIEMMRQIGFCSGIENYSRHIDGRAPGTAPNCLLDYFPEDFLLVIDESHVTVPQIGAMYEGDMSRKRTLVDHGFRLPCAMDNRPLQWEEFLERIGQTVYLSATPGPYELAKAERRRRADHPPHRPDRPRDHRQAHQGPDRRPDRTRSAPAPSKNERVLVTTLTKKMAEDLTDYLLEQGVRVRYLHSEVDTLRRVELLRELRLGEYDVLVGINLLREGLDLPEVSLVAILDADKEGFLRSRARRSSRPSAAPPATCPARCTCTPTRSRLDGEARSTRPTGAARSRSPTTPSTASTRSRCASGSPTSPTCSPARTPTPRSCSARGRAQLARQGDGGRGGRGAAAADIALGARRAEPVPASDLADLIQQLTDQMHAAAAELQFELAARLRDEISRPEEGAAADE